MVELLAMLFDIKSALIKISNLAIPAIKSVGQVATCTLAASPCAPLSHSACSCSQNARPPRVPGYCARRPAAPDSAVQQEEAQGGRQVRAATCVSRRALDRSPTLCSRRLPFAWRSPQAFGRALQAHCRHQHFRGRRCRRRRRCCRRRRRRRQEQEEDDDRAGECVSASGAPPPGCCDRLAPDPSFPRCAPRPNHAAEKGVRTDAHAIFLHAVHSGHAHEH